MTNGPEGGVKGWVAAHGAGRIPDACRCDAGMTITIHILNQGQPVGTVEHAPPLTVAEAERGLQDEDISWIGVLQAVGSTVRLPPQHDLADGAAFELVLHRQ